MTASATKPNLLRGKPIRLLDLTPDGFEDFVYATLSEIGPLHGFRVTSGPAESSDSGFDLWGKRISDDKIVCVQCKRLASTFHLSMIGPELGKVAFKSALESSHVSEHLFVLASTIGESLRSSLRETSRLQLSTVLREAVHKHDDLKVLRGEAQTRGLVLDDVCKRYLDQLEVIRVWSARDYDQELGRVWSRISTILERHFTLEVSLREHPRPDFDRSGYLNLLASCRTHHVEFPLGSLPAQLPSNLLRGRGEDPLARDELAANRPQPQTDTTKTIELLANLQRGECVVLHAAGGGGKTTTLQAVLQDQAKRALSTSDRAIPVYLTLSHYLGSLTDNVHRALRIQHGSWLSLPDSFLLLLDGLEDIPAERAQLFLDEVKQLTDTDNVSCIITVRSAGLRQPVSVPASAKGLLLLPLTLRHAIQHAHSTLPADRRDDYIAQLRGRSPRFDDLLFLPFGFATALKTFLESGSIPSDEITLIREVIERRLLRNRMRQTQLTADWGALPDITIVQLASVLAFQLRIVDKRATMELKLWHRALPEALATLREERVFGTSNLSDVDAEALLQHYEMAEIADGMVRISHDVVTDYLAAARLACCWKTHIGHLTQATGEDAWVYAAPLVPDGQRAEYLAAVFKASPILAARCAYTMGPEARRLLEDVVFELATRGTPLSNYQACTCMTLLATGRCIAALRQLLRRPERSPTYYHALKGLAWLGDRDTLARVLAEEEPMVSSGLGVSSAPLDAWHSAPPNETLALARSRIDAMHDQPQLVLSIRTIEAYGDDSDWPRIARVFEHAERGPTFYAAAYCLHTLSASRASSEFRRIAETLAPLERVPYYTVLWRCGEQIPSEALLEALVNGPPPTTESEDHVRREAVNLVIHNPLPPDGEALVRGGYEAADRYRRSDLWQIATAHRLESFDDLALAVAASNGGTNELGMAANFGKARSWAIATEAQFAELALARLSNAVDTEWAVPRVLEYLIAKGRREAVTTFLVPLLRDLGPRAQNERRGFRADVRAGQPVKATRDSHLHLVLPPLVSLAEAIQEFLPSDLVCEIVAYDLSTSSSEVRDSRRRIAAALSPAELDQVLGEIRDVDERIDVLSDVASLGSTEARLEMFCADVPAVLRWPQGAKRIATVAKSYWCERVMRALIKGISETVWRPDVGTQLLRELIEVIADRMDPRNASDIVRPMIETAATAESRDLLEWLCELGMSSRAGVA